ncbi:hypothetical protein AB205_0107420 [Aquarana catesbeiana]|uniref:Peptidase M12A domain-containing protein n=1 Tax=Aquarana catesbeiana TaxID=8400 RepID=A0A2G9PQ59_AQUCT|nr:hypothetical protein AB205_0107420 [Aquarana catesbeiana]
MDAAKYILIICYLLQTLLPLQISLATDSQNEAEDSEEDVSSIIAKLNKGQTCFWPKSSSGIVTVPYTLSVDYTSTDSAIIYSAIQEYTSLTCIRFVERKTETDYIQIQSVDGNSGDLRFLAELRHCGRQIGHF